MLTITKKLDMSPHGVPQVIRVSQYDSDFTLEFKLFASGGNFAISTGTTAEIRGTKQSGTGYSASATLDTSTKVVTVAGAAQMTAVAGMNIFEIVLKKNNKEISSANFCLMVERAALDADTITDESVLKELNAIIESADTATQAAEEAEDAADRAEAAAQSLVIDPTLTLPGQPADAKATGDAIAGLEDDISQIVSGLSSEAKAALLACFEHVAWTDEHGQDYYDRLRKSLNFEFISITASFNQDGNVFTSTDELDDLRPFLTVTGITGDGSEELHDYTLSGNLNSGVSTITVEYAGLTTTFNVSVSMLPSGYTLKNYVQANGTQYVASGIYETDMAEKWTRSKVNVPQMSDSRNGHILSGTNEYSPYLRNNGDSRFMSYNRFGSQNATYASDVQKWVFNEDTIIESYKEENKIYTNGVHQYTVTLGTTKSSQNQMYFFTYGGNVTATQYRFYGKLYYFKIYNPNGIKVHDFIPCKNASNVAGLYDLVSGAFHAPVSGTLATD